MKHAGTLSVLLFSLFLWSCGGDDTPTSPTPTPTPVATSITLSVTSLSFASLGVTSQLSATVTDANDQVVSSATVTWASSDTTKVTVSSAGLVTSVAEGTATITAASGSLSATASVAVAQVAVTLSLSDSTLTFASLADTTQLTATVTDANDQVVSGATVTWASSDTTKVTVSSAGLVTSVAEGTATITATSGSASTTASVTVAQVATSVELSDSTLTFDAWAETAQLTATVKDAGGGVISGAIVTWTTSSSSVVTVSSSGLVTSVAHGTDTVTATSGSASATASVTGVDTRLPEVSWTRTSDDYNDELYGDVVVTVTATDNYGIDSISFFIDETRYAYTGCGGAPTDYSSPITGTTATCSDTTGVFTFTWNSTVSIDGGERDIKTTVYDVTVGNNLTLLSSLTLMHQPRLKYVNLLFQKIVAETKTRGGALLTVDTVAAQDSISRYVHVPTTDSIRVNWSNIRSLRADDSPYGEAMAASWSARAPVAGNKRYTIDNVAGSTTWYLPLWRNSGGNTTVPYIDITLGSEVNICWSSSAGSFQCELPSDSLLYQTGYYTFTGSSRVGLRKKVTNTTPSDGYSWWNNLGVESLITTGSGAGEFHCRRVETCGIFFDDYGAEEEGATDQTGMLADDVSQLGNPRTIDVMIAGEAHTFLVNTDHLRTPGDSNDDISESPGMLDPVRRPMLDSNPVTRPLGGERIPNQARGAPPR